MVAVKASDGQASLRDHEAKDLHQKVARMLALLTSREQSPLPATTSLRPRKSRKPSTPENFETERSTTQNVEYEDRLPSLSMNWKRPHEVKHNSCRDAAQDIGTFHRAAELLP